MNIVAHSRLETPELIGGSVSGRTAVAAMLAGGVVRLHARIRKLPPHPSVQAFGALMARVKACLSADGLYVVDPRGIDKINREAHAAKGGLSLPLSSSPHDGSPVRRTSPRKHPNNNNKPAGMRPA